jgi:hypothetical protein
MVAGSAFAQSPSPQSPSPQSPSPQSPSSQSPAPQAQTPAAAPGDTIEEVVVTARPRSEQLRDVPAAVTAFTSAAIETKGLPSAPRWRRRGRLPDRCSPQGQSDG